MRAPTISLAVLLALGLAVPAVGGQPDRKRGKAKAPTLSVMTRNIYLGADIARPIGSTTREEFAQKNQIVWNTVVRTDFPARAKLLAKEIKRTRPDLIGLQEVALWRTGPVNDPAPATKVAYDFLRILRRELRRAGVGYKVGAVQREADVEGPTERSGDRRLTMRDVILVKRRKGLRVTRRQGRNYKAELSVPTAAGQVTVKRGYVFVDGSLRGRRFRFVNTHLEAFSEDVRLSQAKELVGRSGPTRTKRPLIVLGDMNSDRRGDPNGDGDPVPYRAIVRSGLKDAFRRATGGEKPACCLRTETADDPPPFPADHRIDHVFTKGKRLRPLSAVRVGLDRRNRTKGGLWPSDHGGVVVKLRLR